MHNCRFRMQLYTYMHYMQRHLTKAASNYTMVVLVLLAVFWWAKKQRGSMPHWDTTIFLLIIITTILAMKPTCLLRSASANMFRLLCISYLCRLMQEWDL